MKDNTSRIKKRPYGLSLDGNVSKRLKKIRQIQNDHEPLNQGQIRQSPHKQSINIHHNQISQYCFQNLDKKPNLSSQQHFMKYKELIQDQQHNKNYFKQCDLQQAQVKESDSSGLYTKYQMIRHKQQIINSIYSSLYRSNNKCACSCGKIYKSHAYLQIHIAKKHKNTSKQILVQEKLCAPSEVNDEESKKKSLTLMLSRNWQKKICDMLFNLKLNVNTLSRLIVICNGKNVKLDNTILSQHLLLLFYNQIRNIYAKFAVLYLAHQLTQFLDFNNQMRKIWVLEFRNFPLASNSFYHWLKNKKQMHRDVLQNLTVQAYVLFIQWCYYHRYVQILVVL